MLFLRWAFNQCLPPSSILNVKLGFGQFWARCHRIPRFPTALFNPMWGPQGVLVDWCLFHMKYSLQSLTTQTRIISHRSGRFKGTKACSACSACAQASDRRIRMSHVASRMSTSSTWDLMVRGRCSEDILGFLDSEWLTSDLWPLRTWLDISGFIPFTRIFTQWFPITTETGTIQTTGAEGKGIWQWQGPWASDSSNDTWKCILIGWVRGCRSVAFQLTEMIPFAVPHVDSRIDGYWHGEVFQTALLCESLGPKWPEMKPTAVGLLSHDFLDLKKHVTFMKRSDKWYTFSWVKDQSKQWKSDICGQALIGFWIPNTEKEAFRISWINSNEVRLQDANQLLDPSRPRSRTSSRLASPNCAGPSLPVTTVEVMHVATMWHMIHMIHAWPWPGFR